MLLPTRTFVLPFSICTTNIKSNTSHAGDSQLYCPSVLFCSAPSLPPSLPLLPQVCSRATCPCSTRVRQAEGSVPHIPSYDIRQVSSSDVEHLKMSIVVVTRAGAVHTLKSSSESPGRPIVIRPLSRKDLHFSFISLITSTTRSGSTPLLAALSLGKKASSGIDCCRTASITGAACLLSSPEVLTWTMIESGEERAAHALFRAVASLTLSTVSTQSRLATLNTCWVDAHSTREKRT